MADNKFLVGLQGADIIVVGLPMRAARMSREDALNLAAWLVAMAALDPEKEFTPILQEVLNG
jgi:glutathione S-transferase